MFSNVFLETLRLHPIEAVLKKECHFPAKKADDGYSLEPYHSYKIPRGMPLIIPIHAIHKDKHLFEKPLEFIPDRFEGTKANELPVFSEDKVGLSPNADAGKLN